MFNVEDIKKELPSDYTDDEIQNALSQIDQEGIFNRARAGFLLEVWDRKAPINGVSSEVVLASHFDIPESGQIYLIKDSRADRVIYFQPHKRDVEGFEPITDAITEGAKHVDELAMEITKAQIVDNVKTIIRANRTER